MGKKSTVIHRYYVIKNNEGNYYCFDSSANAFRSIHNNYILKFDNEKDAREFLECNGDEICHHNNFSKDDLKICMISLREVELED